jgi:FKBP-type peptidyl-prolyl cis-trans isomerase
MKKILFAILVIGSMSGCLKGEAPSFTCTYNECGVVAPAAEIQRVKDYLDANNITNATQHCSGMFYTIDAPGSGAAPTVCNVVSFTYEGRLTDGTVFDKSVNPISGGLSGFITGFKNGLPLIKPGGRIHLYIPPSLGYGQNPNGPIPGNSVLVFEVNLVAVQ